MAALSVLSFLYLVFFPEYALESTRTGLLLWYHSVLPVLFPFMLLCTFLIRFRVLERMPEFLTRPLQKVFSISNYGSYAVIAGFLCGFPIGAKLSSDLYREGKIDKEEARLLYGFTNNLSPVFLISYAASEQMEMPEGKIFLLFHVLGAAFLYGAFTSIILKKRNRQKDCEGYAPIFSQNTSDTYDLIDSCIYDTVQNMVKLGVYITVFKIISDGFFHLVPFHHPIILFLGSLIEVTGGIHMIAQSALAFPVKYILVCALCAFGGFSALAQTVSIASFDRSTFLYYIKSRVMITLLSILLSTVFILFFFRLPFL